MTDPVFFSPTRSCTATEISELTGARLIDPAHADVIVRALAPAGQGGPGTLVFLEGKRNARLAGSLRAAAVLCSAEAALDVPDGIAVLVTPYPQRAFASVGRMLYPTAARPAGVTGETGLSPQAHVHASARVEPGATIEAGAVVGPWAAVGRGTVVAAHAVIGPSCQIGRDGYVGPHATILNALLGDNVIVHGGVRIGQDGFGYVPGASGPEKIPQIGRVVIQNGVEIGANSTIDRGAMSDTIVGENTKIDNLVQIAHNVRIGRRCLIAGLCGISGSVTIEDNVMMGGGVGIADHLTIGEGAQLAAGSGLMHDVPRGEVWAGYPARPMAEAMRDIAMLRKLGRAGRRKG